MRLFKERHPDNGIVYQRGIMQFWVPSSMAKELPHNPRQLPVVPQCADPLWYYMWYVCLQLANRMDDEDLKDKLLIEVLRR